VTLPTKNGRLTISGLPILVSTGDIFSPCFWATSHGWGTCGPRFPILLEKVIYDGTHTGDWIPIKQSPALLKEVDIVLHSSDILAESEKEFFGNMKELCEASIATGNPIMF
jgi:hypothetical protein